MRLLAMVAALTLAVSAPVADAPSLASSGLVVADNGTAGFIGGVPDERWDQVPDPADEVEGPADEADAGRGSERAGLVPRVLTVLLGLTAAALAARAIRRSRPTIPGR